jgi:hypothetical protein
MAGRACSRRNACVAEAGWLPRRPGVTHVALLRSRDVYGWFCYRLNTVVAGTARAG